LIKPSAIDTRFTQHAKSYLPGEPQHVPPVYSPESVAEAILHAAETPVREMFVGSRGKLVAALGRIAPNLTDRAARRRPRRARRVEEARRAA
jgi:hypothetical protein